MPDEITHDDIPARLRALLADDSLRAAAHRMEALLDQTEARGLELMQQPETHGEGQKLVAEAQHARSSDESLVRWIEGGPDIPEDLVEQFCEILDG